MKVREILVGIAVGFGTAAMATPTNNWLYEAVLVRLPQSEIVRHPVDNSKYYLCWSDGVDRVGLAFRRSQLDSAIRSIPRAGRASVATLMAPNVEGRPIIAPWTSADEKICWPD